MIVDLIATGIAGGWNAQETVFSNEGKANPMRNNPIMSGTSEEIREIQHFCDGPP